MNKTPIIVATTANDNYFQGLCVTVLSAIVSTHPEYPLSFRIFDTGLSESNKQLLAQLCGELKSGTEVRFLPITESQFTGLSTDHGGGHSTYARLLMGSLIPESRTIYVDSDFLVMKDLAEIWHHEFAGNLMLATKDYDTPDGKAGRLAADCPFAPAEEVHDFAYYNCGFLMVDLDAWRMQAVEKTALAQIKGYESQLKAWDQTILNYVLRGKIGEIAPTWCWSCKFAKVPDSCNIHYISRMKPWNAWAIIPAYKLWYLFHSIIVAEHLPLAIPFKAKCRGLFRYLRDYSFFSLGILGDLYVKSIERRRGKTNAALYASHLRKSRQAIREPDWKSTVLIRHRETQWNEYKHVAR
jgi:lipopolysaccharide biosynthesis glycosyltransferase